jgi:hypothetical protein
LVVNLDAGDPASYPRSGTTWTNLVLGGTNAILYNNPSYNSALNGFITYNGTNQYADFSAGTLGSTVTVEMWAKYKQFSLGKMAFGWYFRRLVTAKK